MAARVSPTRQVSPRTTRATSGLSTIRASPTTERDTPPDEALRGLRNGADAVTTMQLLKRTPPTVPMDEHLSYFTSLEASEFRRLVESSFANAGRDVTIHGGQVEDRTGTVFGLGNIAALCRGLAPSEWRGVIDDHVARVTTPPRGLVDLSEDELRAGLYLRLARDDSVPETEALRYVRRVAPGLLELLSVDLPEAVAPLRADDVTGPGSLSKLITLGYGNLRALLEADDVAGEVVTAGRNVLFTRVTGDSFFTASLALLVRETVLRFSGEDDWGRGVLVAVPGRHELMYRLVDGRSTMPTLRAMFDAARGRFQEAPGPLSPDVYHVRDRRWAPVTSVDGGRARVLVRGEHYPA